LPEIAALIHSNPKFTCGLATDGDADRIGFFDEFGNFVDSHHLILLLIAYLTEYKGFTGKVVKSFSVSDKVEQFCRVKGLESITTKIGFKYICEYMVTDDVLIGAEESGGIAIKGHIPERDGIWMGLIIWEYMAKSGKSLEQLINEIYELVGEFKFERNDLHITEEMKQNIIANCKAGNYKAFGDYEVKEVKTIDGFKYFFDENRWMMIRPSGTEPVLRTYAEAPTLEEVRKILKMTEETICK
jgi:phosphomannomutase